MATNNAKQPTCNCGTLTPQDDDTLITAQTPEQIIAQVNTTCNDQTGVFFFRSGGKLYMRTVVVE